MRTIAIALALVSGACSVAPPNDFLSVGYFRDPSAAMSFEAVLEQKFQTMPTATPNFGYTRDAIWLRLELRSSGSATDPRYLHIAYPLLDDIQLYQRNGASWQIKRAGDHLPFGAREIESTEFFLRIDQDDAEQQVLYLRIVSSGPLIIPLRIEKGQDIPGREVRRYLLFGGLFGLFIVIALFNLALFLSVRDPVFLYYSIYVSLMGATVFTLERFDFQLFWGEPSLLANRSFGICGSAAIFWVIRFSRRYLETETQAPSLHRVLGAFSAVQLACMGAFFLALDYAAVTRVLNVSSFMTILLIIGVSVWLILRGLRAARFFAAAWGLLLIGALFTNLRFEGIVPDSSLTRYGLYIGAAFEVVLISFGLGDRINQMRLRTEQAQQESIERQRTLKESYARFVPEELLSQLGQSSILDLRIGDAVEKEMTILFSDIRSFTQLSEAMSPRESFEFINNILQYTGPVIRQQGGYIDKYIGDGIMVLFPESPEQALRSAIEMRRMLNVYNSRRREDGLSEIKIGIGINSGAVMLGVVGEEERLEGTVIADAVNLAARLEGLCKSYGATILISEQTLFRLPDPAHYNFRILDYVRVKGKADVVTVVEVFDGDAPELLQQKKASRSDFERAVAMFREGHFAVASEKFLEIARLYPDDPTPQIYAQRATAFLRHSAPPDWDGVTDLNS